jgi:hypothetical protein
MVEAKPAMDCLWLCSPFWTAPYFQLWSTFSQDHSL